MAKVSNIVTFKRKPKTRRKGIHSKTKTSINKQSKNYAKRTRGQGSN